MGNVARSFLVVLGTLSLVVGVVGIFLALIPTTPFLLLSAFCYSKSSPRLHQWLLNHKWMGNYIRNWYEDGSISLTAKVIAVTLIVVSIGFAVIYVVPQLMWQAVLIAIGVVVSTYIITRPTAVS